MVGTKLKSIIALPFLMSISACAPPRPVLYPNERLARVGSAVAEQDVNECMKQAEGYAPGESAEKAAASAATSTVGGAAVGAAAGGAGGAVVGQAGQGAAVGAASGAAGSVMYALLQRLFAPRKQPSPAYRDVVNRCLREKGYDVNCWN